MKQIPSTLACVFVLLCALSMQLDATTPSKKSIEQWTLSHLEERLAEIDHELPQLSQLSLRGGVGSIGYRSAWWQAPEDRTWVEVQLDHTVSIDCVVLAPTIWRTSKDGFQADAFPPAFRIVAGTEDDKQGHVVAEFDEHDAHLPRIAPLVIPIEPMRADWVRLESPLSFPSAITTITPAYNLPNSSFSVARKMSPSTKPSVPHPIPPESAARGIKAMWSMGTALI